MRKYRRNNREYISVTSVIDLMHPFDEKGFRSWCMWKGLSADWVMSESKRIGTLVHNIVENSFLGIDSWANGPVRSEKEKAYRDSAMSFMRSRPQGASLVACEEVVWNDDWGYAGTYDCRTDSTLFDLKTWGSWKGEYKERAEKFDKVALQLSMYKEALGLDLKTAVVILLPDATFEVVEVEGDDSWKGWIEKNRDKLNL